MSRSPSSRVPKSPYTRPDVPVPLSPSHFYTLPHLPVNKKNTPDYRSPGYKPPLKCIEMIRFIMTFWSLIKNQQNARRIFISTLIAGFEELFTVRVISPLGCKLLRPAKTPYKDVQIRPGAHFSKVVVTVRARKDVLCLPTLQTESPSIFPDESGRGRSLCRHPWQFILTMLQIQIFLRRQSNRYHSIHCVCQHM